MQGSIARHHVDYRIGSRSPAAAALIPSIDRAIEDALADAIEQRLERALGGGDEVIVIREATARVVLHARDCVLTSSIRDRISASAADAVISIVSSPASSDAVRRFGSEVEFVGSFIAEVLGGTALDRWFFGPLHRYARTTPEETIAAVLADHDAGRILQWLREHGLELQDRGPGSSDAIEAGRVVVNIGSHRRDGVAALMDAAYEIVTAAGWSIAAEAWRRCCADFIERHSQAPNWQDSGALTSWVIELIRSVATETADSNVPRRLELPRVEPLLRGGLDWLDIPRVRAALEELADEPSGLDHARARVDTARADSARAAALARVVAAIAEGLRRGTLHGRSEESRKTLRALIGEVPGPGVDAGIVDAAFVGTVERIIAACVTLIGERARNGEPAASPRSDDASSSGLLPASSTDVHRAIAVLKAEGPAVAPLLKQLLDRGPLDDTGELTAFGGLFLLTRPVMDVKLPMLAREASIPLPSVLAKIARALFAADPPFDGPARAWIGSSDEPLMNSAPGDERLEVLRASLEELLFDQCLRPEAIGDDAEHPRIVTLLLRAWARWLPALHDASVAFLVRNCLRRGARVRMTDAAIDVVLDPAPLDVVLEMAGCFRPIESVGWLGGRRMTFAVAPRPSQAS